MSTFRPCPFCGSILVNLSYSVIEGHGITQANAQCAGCDACGPMVDVDDCARPELDELDSVRSEAAAIWNKRDGDDVPTEGETT